MRVTAVTWLRARAARGRSARRRPVPSTRRSCRRTCRHRRVQLPEDLRPAHHRAGRRHGRRGHPARQVPRHRRLRHPPGAAPRPRRLGALEGRGAGAARATEQQVAAGRADRARQRCRARRHRGRHPQEPGAVRRPRPRRRRGHRPAGSRPAGRRLHHRRAPLDPRQGRPGADQGRAAPPEQHRRHRQRLLRRAAARRQDVAVQAVQQPRRRRAADPVRRDPQRARRRREALRGAGRQRAQGREEEPHGGARPHRPEVPRVRRHRARGQLRRLEPAVLRRPARPAESRWPTGACPSS